MEIHTIPDFQSSQSCLRKVRQSRSTELNLIPSSSPIREPHSHSFQIPFQAAYDPSRAYLPPRASQTHRRMNTNRYTSNKQRSCQTQLTEIQRLCAKCASEMKHTYRQATKTASLLKHRGAAKPVQLQDRKYWHRTCQWGMRSRAMQLNHDYSPARIPPATVVLAEMYHSPALYNEGLLSFEYPLYRATDEELDHFLGSLVRSATKAVGGVAKTAGSLAKQAGKADLRQSLQFAGMVAPFIPGVGTGVAAALGAANALASGQPITEALIAAARSAIPGGAVAQMAFDTAVSVARGKNISDALLN